MFAVNGLIAGWNMYTRQDGGKRRERFIGFAVINVCGNTKVCTQLHRKTWYDVRRRNGGTGHPPFLRGFLHGHKQAGRWRFSPSVIGVASLLSGRIPRVRGGSRGVWRIRMTALTLGVFK